MGAFAYLGLVGLTLAVAAGVRRYEPAVLVRGDAEAAKRRLRKRVVWLGGGGAATVVGGQLLAFRLSSATLAGLP